MTGSFRLTSSDAWHRNVSVSADEMPGGHLVALSQPEELKVRLERYAADVCGA